MFFLIFHIKLDCSLKMKNGHHQIFPYRGVNPLNLLMLPRANNDRNLPSQFETKMFRVRGKHWVTHRLKAVQCFLPGKSMLIPLQLFFFFSLKPLPQDLIWG